MKITKEIRRNALFMALGNGFIDIDGRLSIKHNDDKKEYIKWKYSLIKAISIKSEFKSSSNNGFIIHKFITRKYKFLKLYKRILLNINRKLLNKLTPLGIYIWYIDKGSLSRSKLRTGEYSIKEIILHTGFSKEKNQIIIDYFKDTWNVDFCQIKDNSVYKLRCGNKEDIKFLDIFKEHHYSVPSMLYKINPNSY